MFIVHGKEKAAALRDKYTVLELDTIKYTDDNEITLYTVVDTGKLSLESMTTLGQYTELHAKLIENLKKGDANFCVQAIEHLKGQFGGDLDTFYDHVLERLET